ncbi:MAG: hypothetical protein ABIU10_10185 [Sphingomicrobium sp.]
MSEERETSYHREERRRFKKLDRETPFIEAFILNGFPGLPLLLRLNSWLRKISGGYRNG